MKYLITLLIILFSITKSSYSQDLNDSISAELVEIMKTSGIPGLGVAIVSIDSVFYLNGFGNADIETGKPYTENTLQNIGSVSKTFIAVALMQLIEQGKIQLDNNINDYLPFRVVNANFPDSLITVRMLAAHTGGLTDGKDEMLIERSYLLSEKTNFKKEDLPEGYFELFEIYNSNVPLTLEKFLFNFYSPEGDWYESSNFLKVPPGFKYNYTNAGATLLAFIIEQVSDESFDEYTRKHIFEPLKMDNTHWSYENADSNNFASLYMSNKTKIPHYSLITYPDGGLVTSVKDLSIYLKEMIKGINGESKLLSQESFKEMMSNQLTEGNFPNGNFEVNKGLIWDVNKDGDNIGMNGADPGIFTYVLFTTSGDIGIIIFNNISFYEIESFEKDFKEIRKILMSNAGKFIKRN